VQLQSESTSALNTVTGYGNDYIEINAVSYRHAVSFGPEGEIRALPVTQASQITAAMLREIAGLPPAAAANPLDFLDDAPPARPAGAAQIVLIGTGARQHFLPAALVAPLNRLGIGVETMDTQAAARTYNILMNEGRRVVAALLPPETPA
jgi:uncharacterized protein